MKFIAIEGIGDSVIVVKWAFVLGIHLLLKR